MEKTLIRQNAQWNGKMFDHLCPRDIMDNLLKKKTMRHVQKIGRASCRERVLRLV